MKNLLVKLITTTTILTSGGQAVKGYTFGDRTSFAFLGKAKELIQLQRVQMLEKERIERLKEQKRLSDLHKITYDYNDLRVKSNITSKILKGYLESNTSFGEVLNDFHERGTNLDSIASSYVDAEQKYGVNALYLVAITLEESGRGTSELTITHNNISGTRITDDEGSYVYKYFNSLEECIDYTARNLAFNYLDTTGTYHNGFSLYAVNSRYCFLADNVTVDRDWGEKVQAIVDEIYRFLKNEERKLCVQN